MVNHHILHSTGDVLFVHNVGEDKSVIGRSKGFFRVT